MKKLIIIFYFVTFFLVNFGQVPFFFNNFSISGEVIIGPQTWQLNNLSTVTYSDGSPIPKVTDGATWAALSTPAYCWYDNDSSTYASIYGALYNWYAVETGNLCPDGWHEPTDAEFTILTDYLGGLLVAGGKMKEIGLAHWSSPNTNATNSSGFTALPGGFRNITTGAFGNIGNYGYYWSITEKDANEAYNRRVDYDGEDANRFDESKKAGYSLRCIKD